MKRGILILSLFLVSILFISGCDRKLLPEQAELCADEDACNYGEEKSLHCIYPEENYDCDGTKLCETDEDCGEDNFCVDGNCIHLWAYYCDDNNPDTFDVYNNFSLENPYCENLLICGEDNCKNYQECVNDKCLLKESQFKVGLVYLYSSPETYNPSWENILEDLTIKIENSIYQLTDEKISPSIDILGEVQTELFCWNPARLNIRYNTFNPFSRESLTYFYYNLPGSAMEHNQIVLGVPEEYSFEEVIEIIDCDYCGVEEYEKPEIQEGNQICEPGVEGWETQPGECIYDFFYGRVCEGATGEFVWDCQTCGCPEEQVCNEDGICDIELRKNYEIYNNCENPLSSGWDQDEWNSLMIEISSDLGFDFKDYDKISLIIGNFGDAKESDSNFMHWKCYKGGGYIAASPSMIGENTLFNGQGENYFIDCPSEGFPQFGEYAKPGWQILTHELLHLLGAEDVYSTFLFGDSYYEEASQIDSNIDKSIMGNNLRDCMEGHQELDGDLCSLEDIEDLYLDKYNRILMGLE